MYQKKPVKVSATVWHSKKKKGYGHPKVSGLRGNYKTGEIYCQLCGKHLSTHGITTNNDIVCPGDWIITKPGSRSYVEVVKPADFERDYEFINSPVGD